MAPNTSSLLLSQSLFNPVRQLQRVVALPYGFDQHFDQLAPQEVGGADLVRGLRFTSSSLSSENSISAFFAFVVELGAGGMM